MSCEKNGDCKVCCHGYCPESIEEINSYYIDLKGRVLDAREDLEDLRGELTRFEKDNKEILTG